MKKTIIFLALVQLVSFTSIYPQSGTLDSSFNADGILVFTITQGNFSTDNAYAISIQPDGKIIVAGKTWTGSNSHFAIARITTAGILDSTFHDDGIATTAIGNSSIVKAIAIQQDGKIIAAGHSGTNMNDGFLLARFKSNGSLDSTFGIYGKVITEISGEEEGPRSIVVQSDGKIVVGGYSGENQNQDFVLVRYDINGNLDPTFGGDGKVLTSFNNEPDGITSIALQSDGKIVACGYSYVNGITHLALARYNTDGSLDVSFDSDGILTSVLDPEGSQAWSLAIQNDAKIIVGGTIGKYLKSNFVIIRYNVNGDLDHSFGVDGITSTDIDSSDRIFSIALRTDGKIVAGGTSSNDTVSIFALAQYTSDGILDNTFGTNGVTTTQIAGGNSELRALYLQPDGKIVVAGHELFAPISNWDFVVARYLTELNVGITKFAPEYNSLLIYPNPIKSEAELKYFLTENGTLSLRLFNIQGQLVQTLYLNQFHEAGLNSDKIYINSYLPSSLYLLELNNGKGKMTVQIVKE